jgi:hypothetical protein
VLRLQVDFLHRSQNGDSKLAAPSLSSMATGQEFVSGENGSSPITVASTAMAHLAYVIADVAGHRDTRGPGETVRTCRPRRTSKRHSSSSQHLRVFAPIYHEHSE